MTPIFRRFTKLCRPILHTPFRAREFKSVFRRPFCAANMCVCACVCVCACACVLQMHDKFAIYSGSHLRRQHTRTRTAAKFSTGSSLRFLCVWPQLKKFRQIGRICRFFGLSRDRLKKSASLLCLYFSLLIIRLFDHLDEITSDVKKSSPNIIFKKSTF